MRETIIYFNGGESYKGTLPGWDSNQKHKWVKLARVQGQTVMYSGIKQGSGEKVIVFDKSLWSEQEKQRRNSNGFIGIHTRIL